MFDQARALDSAMRSSESYFVPQPVTTAATASEIVHQNQVDSQVDSTHSDSTLAAADPKWFFSGNSKHTRSKCPAKDAICNKCQKRGHFVKVCRGKASKPDSLSRSLVTYSRHCRDSSSPQKVNTYCCCEQGPECRGTLCSGSSESYIHPTQ